MLSFSPGLRKIEAINKISYINQRGQINEQVKQIDQTNDARGGLFVEDLKQGCLELEQLKCEIGTESHLME